MMWAPGSAGSCSTRSWRGAGNSGRSIAPDSRTRKTISDGALILRDQPRKVVPHADERTRVVDVQPVAESWQRRLEPRVRRRKPDVVRLGPPDEIEPRWFAPR